MTAAGSDEGGRLATFARPSRWPTRAFGFLAWGLSMHIVAMAVLFGGLGLDASTVRTIATWKEVTAMTLVAAVLLRAASGNAPRTSVSPADVAVLTLLALTGLHALAGAAGLGPSASVADVALATRDLTLCFGLYLVGRGTAELADGGGATRHLMLIGIVTSAVAVLEWWLVTPEALVVLGVASYFNDFLGLSVYTANNAFGLPDNYWTAVGGRLVQRAGSVYLSSQGFAITFLLMVPAATLWMNRGRNWTSPLALLGYAVLWTGLLLSVTRMTILACLLQVLLLLLLARRPAPVGVLGVLGVAALTALLVAVPGLAWFVWETLTWQTGSSASHSKDYVNGLVALWERPLGSGIGTVDQTATRLGRAPLTADNYFLKYAVELGLPGLLALLSLLGAVLWTSLRNALAAPTAPRREFAALAAACTLGVLINGGTAVLTNSPTIAYLYFWIAGTAIAIGAPAPAPAPGASRAPAAEPGLRGA